jgi:hypothetical protein
MFLILFCLFFFYKIGEQWGGGLATVGGDEYDPNNIYM